MRRLSLLIIGIALISFNSIVLAATGETLHTLCNDTKYFCTQVQKGETWAKLFVDVELRNIVMRLNRMNVELSPGMIIAIPHNQATSDVMEHAPFVQQIEPTGDKVVIVNPAAHAWGAYDENGRLVRWGPAAGGKDYCPDVNSACKTPAGKYEVYRKSGAECVSRKFPIGEGGAPMPYCMFFHKGFALHASTSVPGYHASHGCVRIFLEDARWLNQEFIDLPKENDGRGTQVIVLPYHHNESNEQET